MNPEDYCREFGSFPVVSTTITDPEGATAYDALAVRVLPDEHDRLHSAGFHSPSTLYVLFSPGGTPSADYDPHRLSRNIPGQTDWVVSQLESLGRRLRREA